MRIYKKTIILLLILSFAVSVLPTAKIAEAKQKIPDSTYEETVDFLASVGIYSFSDRKENETVTREMLAKMVTDLLGVTGAAAAEDYFTDVDPGDEYYGAIGMAAALGIMNGTGGGLFEPKAPVTYTQAVKAVVSALGYKPAADVTGGFSSGYMRCAYDLGIIKNAPYDYDAPLTFSSAARLIRLSCEAEIYEILYIEGENVYYASEEDKTVLSVYHGVYIDEGIITDNGITALNGKTQVADGNIKIGGRELCGADDKAQALLGCFAQYYYNANDNKLLYLYKKESKVSEVTIKARDILGDASDFSKTCLVTQKNGKTQRYNIGVYADLIYNGALDESFTKDTLKIKDGTLRLLDTDRDGTYDIVIAEEYADIFVSTCNADTKIITSKYSDVDYITIKYGEYKKFVFSDAGGKDISPNTIEAGSVISVFKSKHKEKIRFVVSTLKEEISADSVYKNSDGDINVVSGEKSYDFSNTYASLMKTNPYVYKAPETGATYTAYLNYEGNIAWIFETQGKKQYAYMLAAGRKNTGLNSKDVEVKLYLESDDTAVVPVAKKLTLNGVKNQSGADILSAAELYDTVTGAFKPQLVMVRINKNGELKELDIAKDNTGSLYGFDLENFSLDFVSELAYSPRSINGIRTYNGWQIMDENTKIFALRTISKQVETSDAQEVRVIDYKTASRRYGSCYIKMYDADESWSAAAAVLSEPLDLQSRLFITTDAYMQKNETGEYVQAVNGWWAQDFRSFTENRENTFLNAVKARYPQSDGQVKKGDIYEIIFDIDEKIINARLLYSPARDTEPDYCFFDMNGYTEIDDDTTMYILGYPCFASNDRLGIYCRENAAYVNVQGNAVQSEQRYQTTILNPESTLSVMQYDCETKEVSVISPSQIPSAAQLISNGYDNVNPDTKVFIKRIDGSAYDVVVMINMYCNY